MTTRTIKQVLKTVLFWFLSSFTVAYILGSYDILPQKVGYSIFWLVVFGSWVVPFIYYRKKNQTV
jgi:hypothetical protein